MQLEVLPSPVDVEVWLLLGASRSPGVACGGALHSLGSLIGSRSRTWEP